MRLSCEQEYLHRGLSAVARAIPARTTLPITQHILFDASDGRVLLSATDAETIAITYSIPAEIEEPGSITMPSRLVADFVATLPSETITLSLAGRAKQVSLSCARNTASIGGLDPEDFPPIPPVEKIWIPIKLEIISEDATVVEANLFLNIDSARLCLETFSTLLFSAKIFISLEFRPIFIFPLIIPIVAGIDPEDLIFSIDFFAVSMFSGYGRP